MSIIEQNIKTVEKAASEMESELLTTELTADQLLGKCKSLSEMIGIMNFLVQIKSVNDKKSSRIVKI